jgi:hypothetical protein
MELDRSSSTDSKLPVLDMTDGQHQIEMSFSHKDLKIEKEQASRSRPTRTSAGPRNLSSHSSSQTLSLHQSTPSYQTFSPGATSSRGLPVFATSSPLHPDPHPPLRVVRPQPTSPVPSQGSADRT